MLELFALDLTCENAGVLVREPALLPAKDLAGVWEQVGFTVEIAGAGEGGCEML